MSSSASRRKFLKQAVQSGAAIGAAALLPSVSSAAAQLPASGLSIPHGIPPEQQPLPYAYHALEPVIDAQTMEIHYSKHAAAYAKNFKDAWEAEKVAAGTSMESLMSKMSGFSSKMRNNGGGHYNHELFWQCMKPGGSALSAGVLKSAMDAQFGTEENFRKKFTESAMTRFGSGWAWLYLDESRKLQIGSTPNQDNPLMDLSSIKGIPLLGLDVWEHAYYLKYQNRRAEYVEKWFTLVNWEFVQKRFDSLT